MSSGKGVAGRREDEDGHVCLQDSPVGYDEALSRRIPTKERWQ